MLLSTANSILYIIELIIGFEIILLITQVENTRNAVTLNMSSAFRSVVLVRKAYILRVCYSCNFGLGTKLGCKFSL